MRHRDEMKEHAIRQAAISLINTQGLAGVSMSKIARRANVSPATIYIYFKNKEDLLIRLFLQLKQEASVAMLQGLNEEMSIEASIKMIWRNMYHYYLIHQDEFIFVEQFANSPQVNCVDHELLYSYYQPVIQLFQRGVEQQLIKDIPLELANAFTFYPILQLIKSHLQGDLDLDEKQFETVLDLAWDAVTP